MSDDVRPATAEVAATSGRRVATNILLVAAIGAVVVAAAVYGEATSPTKAVHSTPSAHGTAVGRPVTAAYTADVLDQALLPEITGYIATNAPNVGQYDQLPYVQKARAVQAQITTQPAHCADVAKAQMASPAISNAPAALMTATRRDKAASEGLIAVPDATAHAVVDYAIAQDCRAFRANVAGQSMSMKIILSSAGHLGDGSRVVGWSTQSAAGGIKTWAVMFRSHGYIGIVSVLGRKATRTEAERLAHHAYLHAESVLPDGVPAKPKQPSDE